MVHGIEASHHGKEHLGRADVGCRLVPPDVLLAGLERQPERRPLRSIDGDPDEASREGAAIGRTRVAMKRGMRTAEHHRHSEPLRASDGDIRAELHRLARASSRQGDRWRRRRGHRPHRAASMIGAMSGISPDVPGYCSKTPNTDATSSSVFGSPTTTSYPSGVARVVTTSIVCGWHPASTKNAMFWFLPDTLHQGHRLGSRRSFIEQAMRWRSRCPVRSATAVWKLRSASSLPWEISGWYGV